MLDLSFLAQGQANASAQLDGKNDMTLSLLKAGVIESIANGPVVTNFAELLETQLSGKDEDIAPINIDSETAEVGAIASLFVGNPEMRQSVQQYQQTPPEAVLGRGAHAKVATDAAGTEQDEKLMREIAQIAQTQNDANSDAAHKVNAAVANALSNHDIRNNKPNQALSDALSNNRLATNNEIAVGKSSNKQSHRVGLPMPKRENIRDVDNDLLQAKTFKAQLASSEATSENLIKGIARAEHNPVVSNVMQTVQAAENGLQKMSGENVSSNHINTPFSSANWSQAVQQKVLWMVGAADKSATLTLNPPELGPLKVVVNVDNQSVDTTFISESAEVRQALQESVASLKDRMLESGIQLGQTNIGSQAQSEQAFQQALKQNNANVKAQLNADETSTQEAATHAEPTNKTQSGDGLVDTFV